MEHDQLALHLIDFVLFITFDSIIIYYSELYVDSSSNTQLCCYYYIIHKSNEILHRSQQ